MSNLHRSTYSDSLFKHHVNRNSRVVVYLLTMLCLTHCGGEPPDPVTEIKAMIPRLQDALNRRAIGDLRRLGTDRLEANRLIVDVFGSDTEAQAQLSVDRFQFVGEDVHASLNLVLTGSEAASKRLLILTLNSNKNWRIDDFEVIAESTADSLVDSL